MKQIIKSGFTGIAYAVIGALIAVIITSKVITKRHIAQNMAKAKQQQDANVKLDESIINYEKKIADQDERLASIGGAVDRNYGVSAGNKDVNGKWHASNGTVIWQFENGTLKIMGEGAFDGILDAKGSYTISGNTVKGTYTTTTVDYETVERLLAFSFHPTPFGTLSGFITDSEGKSTPKVLLK